MMSGVAIVDLEDTPPIVEKRDHDRPRGSKNKVKTLAEASYATALVKRRHARPLGSKNKNSSIAEVGTYAAPNQGSNQPILPQGLLGKVFCFFTFVDAICRERQRLPLKFAEFMDGCCGDPTYHYMCSMQVIDITPMKHRLTSITSIRVV
jgi:hypothetical protein